jgi:hypothetical protein
MKSFNEIDSYNYERELKAQIAKEIENEGKEQILGVDEEDYKKYLYEKYSFEQLVLTPGSEQMGMPDKTQETREDRHYREKYTVEVYNFTITYHFTGSPELFKVRAGTWVMRQTNIYVDDRKNTVSIKFKVYKQDATEFNRAKKEEYDAAFINLDNANTFALTWNNQLKDYVKEKFEAKKNFLLKENSFFTAINIPVDATTNNLFTAPTIKKKDIPKPTLRGTKEYSSEPIMSPTMYEDVIESIYSFGKSMERKPSTYQGKDEEALRDQFLLILETRYAEVTATGETFNKTGKTDILLKYAKDGTNLFIAECKFWHGQSEFLQAISQLFDRYLTWRDSKVAMMFFVSNKQFSSVLKSAEEAIKTHPYYISKKGQRGESSLSYLLHLPGDQDKIVHVEVMFFHFS